MITRPIPPLDAPALARFAVEEFRRRQKLAQAARDQGRMTREAAERHVRPWLAIAAAMGADLPELHFTCDTWTPAPASSSGAVGSEKGAWHVKTHRLPAWEICDPSDYCEALAAARDAALNSGREDAYARAITALANHLGTRAWRPKLPFQPSERAA